MGLGGWRDRRWPPWQSTAALRRCVLLSVALGFAGVTGAAFGQSAAVQRPAAAGWGQVNGTVVDGDGNALKGAEISLVGDGMKDARRAQTNSEGRFHFEGAPAGAFRMVISAVGMTAGSFAGVLQAGEIFEVPAIKLGVAAIDTSVQVTATQEELADAELKVEEHQRLIGFIPNFFVSYDWHAAPLTTKQKFTLSGRNVLDPANIAINLVTAGVQQSVGAISGYGPGPAGYGKRFGADTGDLLVGTFMGGAVFPTVFRQDPRYFYKGTGSVKARAWYALTRAVIARGDNGKWQPSYAGILGDLSAGAIANTYYPKENRNGAALTFENGLLAIGEDALSNVVQELVFKHLTPHAPNYGPAGKP